MKYLIILLLLASCRATDLAPDEFGVQFGQGSTEGTAGKRGIDADTDWVSLGWTWKIGDKADRQEYADREARYLEALHALQPAKAPEPVAAPAQPQAKPEAHAPEEPKKEGQPIWAVLLPTGTTLLLAVAGYLNRRGTINYLSPKHE